MVSPWESGVSVGVDVAVGSGVGVSVGVGVAVGIGVGVAVSVGSGVGVRVDVAVGVWSGRGGRHWGMCWRRRLRGTRHCRRRYLGHHRRADIWRRRRTRSWGSSSGGRRGPCHSVAVISATTVARTSGACVGLASAWTTAAGSGSPEVLGSPQLRHKAIANASATGFHNLVVFTQPLLGIHTADLSPIPPQGSI